MKSRKRKIVIYICFVIFVALSLYLYFIYRITPIIYDLAKQKASAVAARAVEKAAYECIEKDKVTYSSLMKATYNSSGEIITLSADTASINRLKSEILLNVYDELYGRSLGTVGVNMGSVIDGTLLSGKGPKINVKIISGESMRGKVYSDFRSEGINQTLHRIVISLELEIILVMPLKNADTSVQVDVVAAETVILGKVPEAFTRVEMPDEDIPDDGFSGIINDYGAVAD